MSDTGRLERTADWLRTYREATDLYRLRAGIMVAQMDGKRIYGAGVVDTLAREASIHKSTLYEYAAVARFLVSWLQFSARSIFRDFPMLTYSHLRTAIRLEYEDAIDALLHAAKEGLTVDEFSVFVAELRGKEVALPLFRQAGSDHQVIANFHRNYRANGRRIEITVKEVK